MTIRALSTAATGMTSQMRNIDVIANNIANVSTTGFKKQVANFEDLFYQELNIAGGPAGGTRMSPIGSQIGTGVRLVGTQRIFSQGVSTETQKPYDVMIEGQGFFRVNLGNNEFGYTRNGNFHVDANGNLVTSDGYLVSPNIRIPENSVAVNINRDGTVLVRVAGQDAFQNAGQLNLYRFTNPAGLEAIGECLFKQTASSGASVAGIATQQGFGQVIQGFLEQSNVDVVTEMVAMIQGQRAYEINANSIQTADAMLQVANNLRR